MLKASASKSADLSDQIDSEMFSQYKMLLTQVKALIGEEKDLIANLANLSALIFNNLDDINWAGFYLYKENQLVLGPFQGNVACVRIELGKGVCGTAALTQSVQRVGNVHEFEGHIACDAASKSEIVVPIVINGQLIGVLDVDSPIYQRFGDAEQLFFEQVIAIIETVLGQT